MDTASFQWRVLKERVCSPCESSLYLSRKQCQWTSRYPGSFALCVCVVLAVVCFARVMYEDSDVGVAMCVGL